MQNSDDESREGHSRLTCRSSPSKSQRGLAAPIGSGKAALRIVHVNTARDFRGGERQTLLLASGLWRTGVDVRVVTPPGAELEIRLASDGFPADRIHAVRMRGELHPTASMRIARICRRHEARILHLHTAHAHALGVAAAFLTPGTRTVVARRVDYPMARGFSSRLKYRLADHYIAISEAVRRILLLDGIDERRVHLVRSGVRVPGEEELATWRSKRPDLRARWGIPLEASVILNVGSLVAHKGQEILADAARILRPGVRILIAGEGPLRPSLEQAIARAGVADRVQLLGHQPEIDSLYALADAYVQPSTSEGLGTAMLDAMAFGLPIVATQAGGIPEAVRDGVNGILLAGRNPHLMGEALRTLLDDAPLAQRLGDCGRQIVRKEFSQERMIRETLAVYEEMLQCPARG